MSALARLILAFAPLALTPALVHLLADGDLDLGGGEKDLVLVLPWLLGSGLFAAASLLLWRRGWPLARASLGAAALAGAGILLAAALLAGLGLLGIRG